MEDLNERIRQAIADKGLKNCGLGKLVSISVPTIDRITDSGPKGTRNPGILTVMEIAHALGRTVSELIGEVEAPAQIDHGPPTWDDLRDCLGALGVADIEFVVELAQKFSGSKDLGKKRQLGQGGKS